MFIVWMSTTGPFTATVSGREREREGGGGGRRRGGEEGGGERNDFNVCAWEMKHCVESDCRAPV